MATSFHLVNNNAASTLASAIDDNDLSASVASGEGAEFDTGKQYLTIGRDTASGYAGEIVDVTSRSTDAFTIASRAADGTTATAHEAGEAVECLLVAAHITELQTAINTIENKIDGTNPLVLDDVYLKFGTDSDIRVGYDETTDDQLEWTDGTNLLAYLKDLGTTGMFGVTGRIECPQIGISADTDLLALASGALTVNGTVTASDDVDSTHTFGRGRISSPVSDSAYFSHRDYANAGGAALRQNSFGTVELNAAQTRTIVFKINDTNITQMTATLWTYADAVNIAFNTTTGTKIGTGTTQKIGFWNATPIVQPASANQAALSLDVDVTGGDTVDKTAINTNFTNIQTLVNQLRSDLVAAGLIKGSA